jgi:hypothetical protein
MKTQKKYKPQHCKNCGKKFMPHNGNQKHCTPYCQESFNRKFDQGKELNQKGSITLSNGLVVRNDALGKELALRYYIYK